MTARAVFAVALALASTHGAAAPLRTATPSAEDLLRGEGDGVGITSKGLLFPAPTPRPLGDPLRDGTPAFVWSLAVDGEGRVFAGTGPDGKVLRALPSEPVRVHATAPEPLVTAVAATPDGYLLAATAPDGRIYRVSADGGATLWSETGERYVWFLLPRPGGAVLAATGERGRLLRIDRGGQATVLFDADEPHLMVLSESRDGSILAGGAGRGLIYRIDESGTARVLHDDELPEARGLVEDASGNVYAALLAPPAPDRRLPAVRIQVGGAARPGSEMVGEIDERDGGTMRGVIEGLPGEEADASTLPRGRLLRISPDGTATEIWRSSTEAAFALTIDTSGSVLFGTGEPARLYRVESEDDVSLLATLREGQVSAFARTAGGTVIATSNPAALYRLDRAPPEAASFVSRPLDAGATARWGSLSWRTSGSPGRVEFATRSGNSAEPDGTWTSWSSGLSIAEGSAIPSAPGRFLQWRLRIFGGGAKDGRVHAATASFATENRTPRIRDFRLDGSTRWITDRASFRWSAQDPDGDPVGVDLEVRRVGETSWSLASRADPQAPKPSELAGEPETGWRESRASWEASQAAEGAWDVRGVAHDRQSNAPGEGKEVAVNPPLRIVVDRTPPALEAARRAGSVEVAVHDAVSPVVRLELVEAGRVVAAPSCSDGVCDSPEETFRISQERAGAPGERSVRAFDAAGNVAEIPLP